VNLSISRSNYALPYFCFRVEPYNLSHNRIRWEVGRSVGHIQSLQFWSIPVLVWFSCQPWPPKTNPCCRRLPSALSLSLSFSFTQSLSLSFSPSISLSSLYLSHTPTHTLSLSLSGPTCSRSTMFVVVGKMIRRPPSTNSLCLLTMRLLLRFTPADIIRGLKT
jgi:hypothetical protein